MKDLIPIVVPLGFFAAIAVPVIFLARYRHNERVEMLRQGINPSSAVPGRGALFWGLVFTFVGAALVIVSLMPEEDFWVGGAVSLSLGAAMLVYYKVTASERERMMRRYEERDLAGDSVPGAEYQSSTTGPAGERESGEM